MSCSDYVGVPAPCSGHPQSEAIVGKHRHVAIRQLLPQLKAASTKAEPGTSRDPMLLTEPQTSDLVLVAAKTVFTQLREKG